MACRVQRDYRCLLYLHEICGELRHGHAFHELVGSGATADIADGGPGWQKQQPDRYLARREAGGSIVELMSKSSLI